MSAEEQARKDGWVPQDEWKGDPEQWRDAEEFNKRGEDINAILKKKLDKTEQKLEETGAMINTLVKTQEQEVKRREQEAYDRAKAEYEQKVAALRGEQREAVVDQDVDKFNKAEEALKTLEPPPTPEDKVQENSKDFIEWNEKNPWYGPDPNNLGDADPDLSAFVNGKGAELMMKNPNMTEKELLVAVEKATKKAFPHKFKNQNRDKPGVTDSGEPPEEKGNKTYADLPADVKKTYERMREQIVSTNPNASFTKEDYAKQYFEEA